MSHVVMEGSHLHRILDAFGSIPVGSGYSEREILSVIEGNSWK